MVDRAQLLALKALIEKQLAALPEPTPVQETPAFLSPAEFANRLGIAESTVRRLMAEGLPYLRPRPKLVRIDVAKAEAWLETRSTEPRSAAVDARRGMLQ